MKTLICLLATACVCNASFLGLLGDKQGGIGGDSHVSYSVVAAPSHNHGHGISHGSSYSSHGAHSYYHDHDHGHYQSHGFGNSANVIKVILDEGHSGGHNGHYSYASGHNYGSSGYGQGGEAQIIKVISQNAAPSTPVHINHGYFAGANHGLSSGASYASGYSHDNYSSQLNAILPQILELILGHNSGGSGGDLNSQLVSHFGHSGKAYITPIDGSSNSYYSGGHVVQKGVLKITRIDGEPQVFSSHGPPIYEHHPHGHGW